MRGNGSDGVLFCSRPTSLPKSRDTRFNNAGSGPVLAERGHLVCLAGVWEADPALVERHAQAASSPVPTPSTGTEDCPLCRVPLVRLPRGAHPEIIPWSDVRSPRGRKKQIDTSHYACLNRDCHYFGESDASVHALVSDWDRGQDKDILYLRCQACEKRFTSRLGTPLYHLRTPLRRIVTVMTALSEGEDLAAAGRIFGLTPAPSPGGWSESVRTVSGCRNVCCFVRSRRDMCSWTNW